MKRADVHSGAAGSSTGGSGAAGAGASLGGAALPGESVGATGASFGVGNHGSNHSGSLHVVHRTDGHRNRLGSSNKIQGSGGSVLFSDGSAQWFAVERLTQQADGICYPPVDQW